VFLRREEHLPHLRRNGEMPDSFEGMWGPKDAKLPKPTWKERLKMLLRNDVNLRQKMMNLIQTLERDVRRLNVTVNKYETLAKNLQVELLKAVREGSQERAKAISNVIHMVRQHRAVVFYMKLCFEQIAYRLRLILDIGDIMSEVGPIIKLLKHVAPLITSFTPQLQNRLYAIQDVLTSLTGMMEEVAINAMPTELESKEAADIYEAAVWTVEQESDMKLPDLASLEEHERLIRQKVRR
ncbi:hypothetical protein DRO60_05475, partial [Candidatus Bathyarchaeota archaeon]